MACQFEVLPPLPDARRSKAGTAEQPLTSVPLDRLVPMREVLAAVPYSRTTIYRMVAAGTFPAPMKIGASRIAWRASALRHWLSEKMAAAA